MLLTTPESAPAAKSSATLRGRSTFSFRTIRACSSDLTSARDLTGGRDEVSFYWMNVFMTSEEASGFTYQKNMKSSTKH